MPISKAEFFLPCYANSNQSGIIPDTMSESFNSEFMPPQEKIDSIQQWDSGYKPVVLETLEKVLTRKINRAHPESSKETVRDQVLEKREKLRGWLDAIDNEVVDNFGIFESKDDPGVRFPYTKVLVRKVASDVQNRPANPETEKFPSKTVVLFTPFTPPPGGGPDDIMNTIYDRVLTALPNITERESHHAKNITVYGLGLPTSKWGSISEEWLSDLKKNGFSKYGKLYAEFLKTVFGYDSEEPQQKNNVLFFAGSMGTILASETAKQLPKVWNDLRLLLNNPTGVHNPTGKTVKLPFVGRIPLSAKGTQVVAGFGAEAGIRMLTDNIVKAAMSGAKSAREELGGILQKRGIVPYESEEQNRLKKDANGTAIKLLMKDNPLDTDNFRSYIEQGAFDPATTNSEIRSLMDNDAYKRYFGKNRSLGIAVNFTHWMDPGRWPDKWVRGIDRYEKAVGTQIQA